MTLEGAPQPVAAWARWEVRAWGLIGIGALALAGVFALLLAVSRIPGVETVFPWPVDFFHKGLVIHVVFSFVVWFLAVFGALLALTTAFLTGTHRPRFAGAGPVAVAMAAVSAPLLFIPALLDRGEATLNNYVPTIIDPLYYAGLVLLALGVAAVTVRLLVNVRGGNANSTIVRPMIVAAIIYLIALLCFCIAAILLLGQPPSYAFNEELFWGGGHVLQILNTLLLIIVWSMLAGHALTTPPRDAVWLTIAAAVLLIVAIASPVLYALHPPFAATQTESFTELKWALGPAALVGAIGILVAWSRRRPWSEPAVKCVALSALVFGVGGFLGIFVDGADTRTPAHYHGVIAGVTLAFMGLFYVVLLPALGRGVAPGKRMAVQIYCFAFGQLAACIGLFMAGGFGAPRKTAGDAQGLEEWGAIVGMGLNGLGGLVAVIGGVLFIWTVGLALLGKARPTSASGAQSTQPA